MKVETKEIEYCKMDVQYWADPEVIDEKIVEAVEALRKVRIPGFRPGKAPDYAIKNRCKKQIDNWVAREMASQAYDDIIFDTDIKPIGQPEITEIKLKDKEYFCRMTIFKKPDFELGQYEGLEVPKPDINRDVEGITESSLHSLRLRFGERVPFGENDVVAFGDQITMTSEATIDGENFEEGTLEGFLYTVGDSKFPEFDDFLIGMKPDEEREFDIVFPDDFNNVGGKTASFKVTVHMGMKLTPAEINEEFFEKCGVKSYEELRDNFKKISSARIKDLERTHIINQISKQLVANHDFEIPEFLVGPELEVLEKRNTEAKDHEDLKKKAIDSLKLTLILDSIKNEEPEAFMSDQEAQQALLQRVQSSGQDPNKFFAEAQKNGSIYNMLAGLKDEFVLNWIAEKAKIIE